MLASQVMDRVLIPTIALAQVAVIGFSWLMIRLVVGRDWTRQLAVRRPSFLHVGLVLVGFPALVILSNGGYELAKQALPSLKEIARWLFPNAEDLRMDDMEEMVRLIALGNPRRKGSHVPLARAAGGGLHRGDHPDATADVSRRPRSAQGTPG